MQPGRRFGGRYEVIRRIGSGGFGEVWLAQDHTLQKRVVVKVMPVADPELGRAILRTAPVEVQLRHPDIVPVLDRDLDGTDLWMVMEQVEGETFATLIKTLHAHGDAAQLSTRPGPPRGAAGEALPAPSVEFADLEVVEGWLTAVRDALRLLIQAAVAIGTAHARGIVHRDLKPDNLMYEDRPEGRVPRVIDWGLACTIARASDDGMASPAPVSFHPVSLHPLTGSVGVPDYLPPERIQALPGADTPAGDVYSLGAILYHMLSGRYPRNGMSWDDARRAVEENPAVGPAPAPLIAEFAPEWIAVATQAMAPDPMMRPRDGHAFAEALGTALWRTELRRNRTHLDQARTYEAQAAAMREQAYRLLAHIRPWEDAASRRQPWQLEDQAQQLEIRARVRVAQWRRGVEEVLRARPQLPEAHIELAEDHAAALRAVEVSGGDEQVHLKGLEDACKTISEAFARRGREHNPPDATADPSVPARLAACQRLHRGRAQLTLITDPPGVQVEYAPVIPVERRWVARGWVVIGRTPLVAHEITRGRGMLRLTAPGYEPVLYPLWVLRDGHWDGIAPDESRPTAIALPPAGALSPPGPGDGSLNADSLHADSLNPDGCYVPAGWTWIGGDERAVDAVSRRAVWIDGFVMARDPVTHRQYLVFLNDLVARGLANEARHHAPRQPHADDREAAFTYRVDDSGRYHLGSVHADAPVCLVTWFSAQCYAAWLAALTGRPWRLPSEWEYEKAARGADARRLAWGDHMEAFRSRLANSTPDPAAPAPVTLPTDDISPYGIRWLTGNMRTWCLEAWERGALPAKGRLVVPRPRDDDPPPSRVMRGGSWASPPANTSTASRFADPPRTRLATCGIRLVYSCPLGWHAATLLPVDDDD